MRNHGATKRSCQGEGRGFKSRFPLHLRASKSRYDVCVTVFLGFALLVSLATTSVVSAQVLDTAKLYTFLSAHRLPDVTKFSPPYPLRGVTLDVGDMRINGTWLSTVGAEGPILVVENLGNGQMALAVLLPVSVTGSPVWLYSLGRFAFISLFGGTFYLGTLSGAGLDGRDHIGLSWMSEAELLFTFWPGEWIGPPVVIKMRRLREAL